jgi:transcriptional regulator of acetoin/glycerol metabolism
LLLQPEFTHLELLGEQIRILQWLDEVAGHIRVVSTTTVPIFPRVTRGEFNEVLYYRLNVVYVDVGS